MTEVAERRVRVSSKGQIVIPLEIRERYRYEKGTELIITPLDENRILLERVPKLSELFGFLGNTEASKTLLMERKREAQAERERLEELGREIV
ncbi:MAG: AbrB/MazE/SpoVT family DNA-binding domain-containing protein [Candidatus Bathyarchaeia archaeon]